MSDLTLGLFREYMLHINRKQMYAWHEAGHYIVIKKLTNFEFHFAEIKKIKNHKNEYDWVGVNCMTHIMCPSTDFVNSVVGWAGVLGESFYMSDTHKNHVINLREIHDYVKSGTTGTGTYKSDLEMITSYHNNENTLLVAYDILSVEQTQLKYIANEIIEHEIFKPMEYQI